MNGQPLGWELRDINSDPETMTGKQIRYWTTEQVDEKLSQYRKEIAELKAKIEQLEKDNKFLHSVINAPKGQCPF